MIVEKLSTKIPNILFYNPANTNIYKMIDRNKGSVIGEMHFSVRNDLYINSLDIDKNFRRQGFGKRFLNFARNLSKSLGLEGKLRVLAGANIKDLQNPSFIFYRKYGFTSDNKETLKIIDEAIKNNTQIKDLNTPPIYMYYQ